MTRTELETRINELERDMFFLDMKDRWTDDDYRTHRAWFTETLRLRKELKELEAAA